MTSSMNQEFCGASFQRGHYSQNEHKAEGSDPTNHADILAERWSCTCSSCMNGSDVDFCDTSGCVHVSEGSEMQNTHLYYEFRTHVNYSQTGHNQTSGNSIATVEKVEQLYVQHLTSRSAEIEAWLANNSDSTVQLGEVHTSKTKETTTPKKCSEASPDLELCRLVYTINLQYAQFCRDGHDTDNCCKCDNPAPCR